MRGSALAIAVLLAGCMGAPAGPEGGTIEARNDGIRLTVEWRTCPEGFCARAAAVNEGNLTLQVCEDPWVSSVRSPDGEGELLSTCVTFSQLPFRPGDRREREFAWDGTMAGGPVPPGTYAWTLAFTSVEATPRGVDVVIQLVIS